MIPKIIHYIWLGGSEMPELAKKCIESWKKYCPDYELKLWNESNYDFTKIPYMKEAFENKKYGFAVDYARLDIIYQYGGIYLDTDVELIKSLDSLLDNEMYVGLETQRTVNMGQGFGAVAKNPIIKRMMEIYEGLSFYNADGSLNTVPSPHYQTQALSDFGFVPPRKKRASFGRGQMPCLSDRGIQPC